MSRIGIIYDKLQDGAKKGAELIRNSYEATYNAYNSYNACDNSLECEFYFVEDTPKKDTEILLVLGGDGFMLHTIRANMRYNLPFYGLNYGTIGFLMNSGSCGLTEETGDIAKKLLDRIKQAKATKIHPLIMNATTVSGEKRLLMAINEVSIFRKTGQAAHIKVEIDGKIVIENLVADGILVATPAGSTAYNFSAGGAIIPVESKLLALTAINPFRPRRWKTALLTSNVNIKLEMLETEKRPANAVADYLEVKNIRTLLIKQDRTIDVTLLFDKGHSLEERIISEQFKLI